MTGKPRRPFLLLSRSLALLALFSIVLAAPHASRPARAGDPLAETRSLQGSIDFTTANIQARRREVAEALKEARAAGGRDRAKWDALDDAVRRYEEVFDQGLATLDSNYRSLVRQGPGARPPQLEFGFLFYYEISNLEFNLKEVERADNEMGVHIEEMKNFIRGLEDRTEADARETKDRMMPDVTGVSKEIVIGVVSGVIIDAVFTGGTVTKIVVCLGVLHTGYSAYRGMTDFAERQKKRNELIANARKIIEELEEIKDSYQPALNELNMVREALERNRKTVETMSRRYDEVVSGWRDLAAEAARERRRDQEEAFAKSLADAADRPPERWGDDPIEVSEYLPEGNDILGPAVAALQAVFDGAAPDVFHTASEKAGGEGEKVYREAWDAYEPVRDAYREENDRHLKNINDLYVRLQERRITLDEFVRSFEASERRLDPHREAMWKAQRELRRCQLVRSHVRFGLDRLDIMFRSYALEVEQSFRAELALWQRRVRNAGQDLHDARSRLPTPLAIGSFERSATGIGERVWRNLTGQGPWWEPWVSPADWQAGLENLARQIDDAGDVYRRHRPEVDHYRVICNQLRREALIVLRELLEFPLLASRVGGWERWRWLEGHFAEIPEEGPAPGFSRWASEVRSAAGDIRQWVEWVEFYEDRLMTAQFRISRLSSGAFGVSLYDRLPEAADFLAGKPGWEGMDRRAERAVPAEFRVIWFSNRPVENWDRFPVRTKVLTGVSAVSSRARTLFQPWERARDLGVFIGVNRREFEFLRDAWASLSPLVADYESFAGRELAGLAGLQAQVAEFKEPVYLAYGAMPGWLRRAVAERHRGFEFRVNSLERLIGTCLVQAGPLGREADIAWLDGIFGKYEASLAVVEEEMRRRREEEERRRAEEEERRRLEEERRLASAAARARAVAEVEEFYAGFARLYERRDASGVAGLLDPGWKAEDGTTLSDLRETLSNSFRIFDEVSCQISNLAVFPRDDGTARAEYFIEITGRVHRTGIRHDESSQVIEIVGLEDGRLRILRTLSGRFWQD